MQEGEGVKVLVASEDFRKAGKNLSRFDPSALSNYSKLSETNKPLVLKFSDNAPKSTLSTFLKDCDDEFIKILDENPKYLECFVSHKSDKFWDIDRFIEASEEILEHSNFSDLQKANLIKWVDHSSDATKFGKVAQKGIDLNDNITKALLARSGKLFDDLANHLKVSPEKLKQYEIYTEVPFITEGGFMKADIVLVKRGELGIEDVIVVENKLSNGTNYTVRQKEGWKKLANGESFKVKYTVEGKNYNGGSLQLATGENLDATKIRPIKISDHGDTDIANTIISDIPVENWKNYESIPK